ncbi:hypothetical protein QTH90_11950 [Variovorax sp. J2P1-59]|uniref:hypothetical protein n=1 Tax=Variovorax flavidus TaxID=3053501 RepID=UPI002575578B|nr:hypothetical protein [Variovorax sp. J2P1-59]MDM0075100.1 hypothetical protein [Variovorax sp. J2P1-59]
MTTRRTIVTSATLLASASTLRSALAQNADEPKEADFLFVQTARGMTYDKGTGLLTLKAVSPVTVFFTDRPERIAGNMKTADFVPFWNKGKGRDSFLADPPNADISMVEDNLLRQVVAVLQSPVLKGDSLSYTIRVLKGKVPSRAAEVSVFIDVIGMPLTPLSYAGVARRAYRRAVIYR